jgi:hypothetical protein
MQGFSIYSSRENSRVKVGKWLQLGLLGFLGFSWAFQLLVCFCSARDFESIPRKSGFKAGGGFPGPGEFAKNPSPLLVISKSLKKSGAPGIAP